MKKAIKKLVPKFVLDYYYALWPFLGAFVYGHPSRKLKLIGITGTNGKTTVTHITSHMLEQAGFKVASVSSLRFKIGLNEWQNRLKMTMPGRMKLQKFMKDAVKAGCEYAVIEVTSEGIKQSRHMFLKFDTVAFTNLTPEHIESHGSFEKYREVKGALFGLPHRTSVVNLDDENSEYFLNFQAKEKIGYTLSPKKAENFKFQISNPAYRLASLPRRSGQAGFKTNSNDQNSKLQTVLGENANTSPKGINFKIEGREFELPLLGEFNIYNALTAVSIGVAQGLSLEKAQQALYSFKGVAGRLEIVIKEPFTVVVDYAHTPDALEKAYKAVQDLKPITYNLKPKMICVLGSAGGGRDKWKRPELGKIASQYCDEIILTDEDPYDEDPEDILKSVATGLSTGTSYKKIINRRNAIAEALKKAQKNDIVLITGKGAEPLMVTAKGPIDWDDREIVKEEYNKLG
ncbi:MAG: UDP-N-acetylmuramoyl-L-alanyl-D-glutamate--2,6-diaminopimelate ligase [Candidatus Spechtbacterales bacterium]